MTHFSLTIEGSSDQRGIHALRAILKTLLRSHQFRCIDIREIPQEAERAAGRSSGNMKDD